MPRLKPISYGEFVSKLLRAGYVPIRKSKHTIYFNQKKQITIPVPHKHSRDLQKGLLSRIIKEMQLTREEFYKL